MNNKKRFSLRLVCNITLVIALSSTSFSSISATDAEVAEFHSISIKDITRLHGYRGLTNTDLMEMTSGKVKRTLWKLDNPKPDQPLGAAEFRLLQQSGELNIDVPENALGNAILRLKEMRAEIAQRAVVPKGAMEFSAEETDRARAITTVAGIPVGELELIKSTPGAAAGFEASAIDSSSGLLELEVETLQPADPSVPETALEAAPGNLSPSNWKWLGPGNVGGRTRSLVIHPDRPEIMWAGAVAGGVWKTLNGGQSWAPLADFMANLNVSSLLLHPGDPNILYAGTGEGFYNLDAFRGAGIFRSTNGGINWEQVPATIKDEFHFVNRLAVTSDVNTLLAATRTGVYFSTDYDAADITGIVFQRARGLEGRDILDIDCHPTDRDKCIAGGRGNTSYYSVDGGKHWTRSTGMPGVNANERFRGRVELTYALGDPSIVYASVARNNGEIYRSLDGGENFSRRHTGSKYLSGQGWYNNVIWAGDPLRPDLVVVGGLDLHRSTDGGRNLVKISEWWRAPKSAHADHHGIFSHPNYNGTTNRKVYFTNDGGIYLNRDVARATRLRGWVPLNNNYGVTQFYGAAGNDYTGQIVGGTQDNGTQVYRPSDGPNGYSSMFGGDGGYSAADPYDPNFMYGEYVYLQIHRSVNGGFSSQYIHNGIQDAGSSSGALFIAPYILDPNDPETLLAGGKRLWRSTNVKASTPYWRAVKTAISPNSPRISAVDAQRFGGSGDRSNIIWVGYERGQVYKSTNGDSSSPSWQRVDGQHNANGLPDRFVTRVRIDPRNPDTVFAMFGGYVSGNVWKTTDGGVSWRDIGGQLPQVTVYDLALYPRDSSLAYLATEVGVFASGDGGETWWPTNQGPANVAVNELFWMGQRLIAVTHGRGIFWIDLSQIGADSENVAAAATESSSVESSQVEDTSGGFRTFVVPVSPFNAR